MHTFRSKHRLIHGVALMALCSNALLSPPALAQESIRHFQSTITVHPDSTMGVIEVIQVYSNGEQIKHGIYRDFPTRYKDRYGNRYVVGFEVAQVFRDGAPEPYHFGSMPNGKRLYIGDPQVYVSTGEHTYQIDYTTDRQLGFFADHDELYWNATGNGWGFPIDSASAVVILPEGVPPSRVKVDGWTGPQDSTAKSFRALVTPHGNAVYKITSPLYPLEGLTIAVSWPKGFVKEPTTSQKIRWFVRDNVNALVCLVGLIIVICYFVWAQMKVGIDPSRGAAVPQWDPPEGLSPAAIRYIGRMGYDNKTLSAALINAAVKGCVRIEDADGVYTIKRAGTGNAPLAPEESAVTHGLFASGNEIVMKQDNNKEIRAAVVQFKRSLASQFGQSFFATHIGYAVIGALLSLATFVVACHGRSRRNRAGRHPGDHGWPMDPCNGGRHYEGSSM